MPTSLSTLANTSQNVSAFTDRFLTESNKTDIFVGSAEIHLDKRPIEGSFVTIDGVECYQIDRVDRMAPFFVTVVSDANHWLFVSSKGALSAGRRSPAHALFPYETVDRIHYAKDRTGGKTILLVTQRNLEDTGNGEALKGRTFLWEPFSERYEGLYTTRRRLAKSLQGDMLRFEEINDDLGLTIAVSWLTSERFGFVKRTELIAHGASGATVRILDGVQNLMPYGVNAELQATRSVLVDAYKKNELIPNTTLGLFTLSAIPVDKAEPSEALKATTVFSLGLEPTAILLSARQVDRFRVGETLDHETAIRAERGAYFVDATFDLAAGDARRWDLVADIEQDAADVIDLVERLADPDTLRKDLYADVAAGTERLRQLVAGADGEQCAGEPMTTARHRMNVLFNIMRGGVLDEGYSVVREDVRAFVARHNMQVAAAFAERFDALPERVTFQRLMEMAADAGPQMERLCSSYLPLSFSRRHGDPSRPWNYFTIDIRNDDGSLKRGYEGNWRDIFQNWEALGRSYPGYLEGMIATFVNASTADGYNPYRITDKGIDWETIEPDDPWSYIGYWGDHQLIYLLRLLVLSRAYHPGRLERLLARRLFSYANVPYRIKPYNDLVRDPHNTVDFDTDLERVIQRRVAEIGTDGKLLWDDEGNVRLVTFAEKLLVPVLAKLTNFIPEGGIWMNTQRPEWNDANNALVGYGVSMVTLFALRRYLAFLRDLLAHAPQKSTTLSSEIAVLFTNLVAVFERYALLANRSLTDEERRAVVDSLGETGAAYRDVLYRQGLSGTTNDVAYADIQSFITKVEEFLDHTIQANRRDDGLFHAYNLMSTDGRKLSISHLYPMLEGQVAALDSGVLSPETSLEVLEALRASSIYQPDRNSYRLYPDRNLPSFLEKNVIPAETVAGLRLLTELIASGDQTLVVRDVRGGVHFNGAFSNRNDVQAALNRLRHLGHAETVDAEGESVLDVFEQIFDHRSYTGRSGTFFGYEGLGSIYWHMVSKLALAAQETVLRGYAAGADPEVLRRLGDAYYDIRDGLGVNKSPSEFGAFPIDAYSHTPDNGGAKQPGMTGQVKEDILCRWGELGIQINEGRIAFRPILLRGAEFLLASARFNFVDVEGANRALDLDAGMLGFTFCQLPVVYRRSNVFALRVIGADGTVTEVEADALSPEISAEIFRRSHAYIRVEVDLMPAR